MPHFFDQTFKNPFVTISYPLPTARTVFYASKVYTNEVRKSSETFEWDYMGSEIASGDRTWSVYASYWFSMSSPMNYDQITRK